MNKSNEIRLSVVIATLGGPHLKKTLYLLNSSSVIPDEILICIPANYYKPASYFKKSNIKVKICDINGQVAQRSEGFKLASGKFVMQLDDDIDLSFNCIEILLKNIEILPPDVALSPSWRLFNNNSIFDKPRSKFYYWIHNGKEGYKPGSIYLSGLPEGVRYSHNDNLVESDWLPGGCVIHRRSNLILDDFFPFSGKAYCEDLIHSTLLKKKGIRLFYVSDAFAYVEMISYTEYSLVKFIKGIISDYQARKFFIKMLDIKSNRIYISYLIIILNYLRNSIAFKLKQKKT